MDTAQTLLSQGNQTQQVQAVTGTIPWIALAVLAGLVVLVFLRKK
ncbi:MAG: hypothetical protein ACRED1_01465 [Limisphaerales bacterium]